MTLTPTHARRRSRRTAGFDRSIRPRPASRSARCTPRWASIVACRTATDRRAAAPTTAARSAGTTRNPSWPATSSFTEGSSVFGGQSNLLQAINNIFTIYDPDVIAVHTTCLSETIGDDIPQIAEKAAEDGLIPEGKT